ncbi:hypothetical protein DPX16_8026 [Anabarilius grahami]|uniref:Uncharacterized protein n=1 Tax=Anabarilius grahami TaxID=495550 RepID=A0A3N0Z4H1_ANAGA|nr:hypothetical protein DPX16_8026 [Anabarilius grahami]
MTVAELRSRLHFLQRGGVPVPLPRSNPSQRVASGSGTGDLWITLSALPSGNQPPRNPHSSYTPQPVELPGERGGPPQRSEARRGPGLVSVCCATCAFSPESPYKADPVESSDLPLAADVAERLAPGLYSIVSLRTGVRLGSICVTLRGSHMAGSTVAPKRSPCLSLWENPPLVGLESPQFFHM